jgi:hypothetical protein
LDDLAGHHGRERIQGLAALPQLDQGGVGRLAIHALDAGLHELLIDGVQLLNDDVLLVIDRAGVVLFLVLLQPALALFDQNPLLLELAIEEGAGLGRG